MASNEKSTRPHSMEKKKLYKIFVKNIHIDFITSDEVFRYSGDPKVIDTWQDGNHNLITGNK